VCSVVQCGKTSEKTDVLLFYPCPSVPMSQNCRQVSQRACRYQSVCPTMRVGERNMLSMMAPSVEFLNGICKNARHQQPVKGGCRSWKQFTRA